MLRILIRVEEREHVRDSSVALRDDG